MSRGTLSRMSHHPSLDLRPGKEHDDTTPPCHFCGEETIGINVPGTMLIKGSFVFSPEHGMSLFLIDPHAGLQLLDMGTGQLAIVADIGTGIDAAHTECIDQTRAELFDELEDEEDELEEI